MTMTSTPTAFLRQSGIVFLSALMLLGVAAGPAQAQRTVNLQELVDESAITVENFRNDPDLYTFRELAKSAHGLFVAPLMVKGGLIVAGSGGRGVLLVRDQASGEWSYPAFYSLGSATIGFTIGGQASEVVMLLMTERAVELALANRVRLAGEANIATGPVGKGNSGTLANRDFIMYSRNKGALFGLDIGGMWLRAKPYWNEVYYGQEADSAAVLLGGGVRNEGADPLRRVVTALGR